MPHSNDVLDRYQKVVIALENSERLPGFRNQRLGDSFKVHTAFDGRYGAGADRFDAIAFLERWGVAAKGGQIGCAISHAEVISAFAQNQTPSTDLLLVAEDDARWSQDLVRVLRGIAHLPLQAGLIVLGDSFGPPYTTGGIPSPKNVSGVSYLSPTVSRRGPRRYRVGRPYGPLWGASFYVMTRLATERFHEYYTRLGKITWLADEYDQWAREAGIDVTVLRPRIVDWEGVSTINNSALASPSQAERIRGGWSLERLRCRLALRTRWAILVRSLLATKEDLASRRPQKLQ